MTNNTVETAGQCAPETHWRRGVGEAVSGAELTAQLSQRA